MKIIKFQELVKAPEGTVYALYIPHVISGFFVKGQQVFNSQDFYECPLIDSVGIDTLSKADQTDDSFQQNFLWCRHGHSYDDECMFVVYDKQDLKNIIRMLNTSIDLVGESI